MKNTIKNHIRSLANYFTRLKLTIDNNILMLSSNRIAIYIFYLGIAKCKYFIFIFASKASINITDFIYYLLIIIIILFSEYYIIKDSDSFFIGILKRYLFYFTIILIIGIIGYLINFTFLDNVIHCDSTGNEDLSIIKSKDIITQSTQPTPPNPQNAKNESIANASNKLLKIGSELIENNKNEIKEYVSRAGANAGVATASGYVAKAIMANIKGMPLSSRVIATTAGSSVAFLGGQLGLTLSQEIRKGAQRHHEAMNKLHNENITKHDKSSGSGDDMTALSPLEQGELSDNPLLNIIDLLIVSGWLDLFLIIIIMYFAFNLLFKKKIASKIKSYPSLAKYEKLNKIINFLFVNSERIDLIIMLFFLILFLLIKIMDIYLLVMVKDHLDELIWVYNDINKK